MPATALEQMILELVNRARLDPAAEAARYGIALNEGVPAGDTISTASKQPLAMNETLLGTARTHSQDMIDRDYFAHDTPEGLDPFERMNNAGYNFTTAGENIADLTSSNPITDQNSILLHQFLFVDTNFPGRGHRVNILNGNFQEIGVGQVSGNFQGSNASMLTEDFGTRGNQQFLTGVSYADTDHDNFYSLGEGRGSMLVSVVAPGNPSTSTGTAGGYSLAVSTGLQTVTFSGGGLASPINVSVSIAAHTNAKVDVIDQGTIATSASLTDLGGATKIIGLGTFGLALTGDSGNDTFVGTKGNDTIDGAGGSDTVVFSGNFSAYTRTNLSNGSIQIAGPDGTDTLSNVEVLQFADQSIPVDHAPQVSQPLGANVTASSAGQVFQFSSLMTATDPDGDALTYYILDNTAGGATGHLKIGGVTQPEGQWLQVTQTQLSQTTFTVGQSGADDIYLSVYDPAGLNTLSGVHVSAPVNHAPVVSQPSGASVTASSAGQVFQFSSLMTATDPDGDALTYYILDNSPGAGTGHLKIGGVTQPEGQWLQVTQAQLGQTTFTAGQNGADDIYLSVYDPAGLNTLSGVHVSAPVNHAPVVSQPSGASVTASSAGQVFQFSSLLTATDPDGDALTYYILDNTAGGATGHLKIGGATQPEGQWIQVTGAQLGQTTFTVGQNGADDIYLSAYDPAGFNTLSGVHVSAPVNHAPVVSQPSGASVTASSAGQVFQVSSLLTATDPDGDALTYYILDNTPGAGTGHLKIGGVTQPEGQWLQVTQTQLSQTTFTVGQSGADDIYLSVYDPAGLNTLSGVHVSAPVNHAPVVSQPSGASVTASSAGQVFQFSSLLTATDSDGDALTYYITDNTPGAGTGHLSIAGAQQAEGNWIQVTQAQLAQTTFTAGQSGADDIYLSAYDPTLLNDVKAVHVVAHDFLIT
jgi:hypothetical protein